MKRAMSSRFLFLALCLSGCVRTEVLNAPTLDADTTVTKAHRPMPPRDTTDTDDTARIPITFNPIVEGWE